MCRTPTPVHTRRKKKNTKEKEEQKISKNGLCHLDRQMARSVIGTHLPRGINVQHGGRPAPQNTFALVLMSFTQKHF